MTGTDLLQNLLRRNGGTKVLAHGLEHVPAHGPVIVASTHPTGMFDFVAHASALQQVRPDLKVVANQEVERFLGPDSVVSVDIDKKNRAKSPRSTYAAMQQHLENDGALLIFGSGRVPGSKQGQLVEPDWRCGTSRISQICQVQIVPASVNARNSRYYYRIRKLAEVLSCGDQNFGAMVGSLRYSAELLEKLGGQFEVHYGAQLEPGTAPQILKRAAERLVPGLYQAA